MTWDRVAFAARRRKAQDDLIASLEPVVGRALERKQGGSANWWRAIVDASKPLFDGIVHDDGGDPGQAAADWARLSLEITKTLTKTKKVDEYSHTLIATWVAGQILSVATIAAAKQDGGEFELEWVSMHDSKVRHTHRVADGQRVKPGDKFRVGTSEMRWPVDTSAPIAEWINCRCTLAAVPVHDKEAASSHTGPRLTQGAKQMTDTLIPWHGVLAPEGKWSGDRRQFAPGSLSHRDLSLPLTWQKVQDDAHNGSVTVASIDWVDMNRNGDGLMHAGGTILQSEEADEWVGLLAHFGKFGVSVDADNAEAGLANEDGSPFSFSEDGEDEEPYGLIFSTARVCSASSVNIPAFAEAFVTMGEDPEHDYTTPAEAMAAALAAFETAAISDKSWDGSASRFTPEQWKASCVLHLDDSMNKSSHKLPIREPNGDLSRAGVHAAAGRIGSVDAPDDKIAAARRAIKAAYSTLGEDPPEGFGRGPGWVTNPEDTKRIHDYWTVPGEPGYEKIAWGTPGDFNRCRVEVGEEIGEGSPEKLRFINQICSQWHKDATGFWPGHAPAEQAAALDKPDGDPAPAISLVASSSSVAPYDWFQGPEEAHKQPFKIDEDGRITGYLAYWDTCHMQFDNTCIMAPRSQNDYGFFLTGEVMTDRGPIATGPLTIGGGHANPSLGLRPAVAHYDDVTTAVADVCVGENEVGIWLAGWVRPWATEQQIYELRAAALSGDWRRVPGTRPAQMELIAALGVNAPGFPAPRVGINNGVQVSLVASAPGPAVEESSDPLVEFGEAIVAAMEKRQALRSEFNDVANVFEEV
jgi:hypothetical protein